MPSLVYEGDQYVCRTFRYQCLKCNDIVESKHRRDFQSCSCGNLEVDGGVTEGRVLGDFFTHKDLCVWTTEGTPCKTLPQEVLDKRYSEFLKKIR